MRRSWGIKKKTARDWKQRSLMVMEKKRTSDHARISIKPRVQDEGHGTTKRRTPLIISCDISMRTRLIGQENREGGHTKMEREENTGDFGGGRALAGKHPDRGIGGKKRESVGEKTIQTQKTLHLQ